LNWFQLISVKISFYLINIPKEKVVYIHSPSHIYSHFEGTGGAPLVLG